MADETQPTQNPPGENTRRESPPKDIQRQHHGGGQRHHFRRGNAPRPVQGKPAEAPDKEVGLDDEDTEQDRTASRGHRGGRQPKKVYEEWANDIYCE
jgi:hypothetical protein